jgi:hypothetical protein
MDNTAIVIGATGLGCDKLAWSLRFQQPSPKRYVPLGCPIRRGPPRAVVHKRQSHAESGTVKISRP